MAYKTQEQTYKKHRNAKLKKGKKRKWRKDASNRLRFLKLESSMQPTEKINDSSLHRFWLIHPCDRRTGGQTDRQTDRQNCDGYIRRAESSSIGLAAFECKKRTDAEVILYSV